MAIPKSMLELVNLHSGSQVNIDVRDGRLIVEPKIKPRYTLAELMAQCDLSQPLIAEEQGWLVIGFVRLLHNSGNITDSRTYPQQHLLPFRTA